MVRGEVTGTATGTGRSTTVIEHEPPPEVVALFEEANERIRAAYALLLPTPDLNPDLRSALSCPQPVGCIQWVHISRVQANDYNPNAVAGDEMRLLYTSISEDGYTQPIVAVWDTTKDPPIAVIVDGFHRYTTMRRFQDVYDASWGYLPMAIIDKPIEDRIASTVRHNRARGKHSVAGMGNLVFQLLEQGMPDVEICRKVGVDPEELARLKHITGYSKLYRDAPPYSKVVLTGTQMKVKADYKKEHPDEPVPQW